MVNRKYEFTDETIEINGHTLHRIRSLIDIPELCVKAGKLGGFIESEENLSHEGNCWIGDNAVVYDGSKVFGNAHVFENAKVYKNSTVCGNAKVFENAEVSHGSKVYGNARVYGDTKVTSYSKVYKTIRV